MHRRKAALVLGMLGACAVAASSVAIIWPAGNQDGDLRRVPSRAPFAPDSTSLQSCSAGSTSDVTSCRAQALGNIAWTGGAEAALDRLASLAESDEAAQSNCHRLAHAIGGATLAKVGSIDDALSQGSDLCISGYGHGVFEEWASAGGKRRASQLMAGELRLCTPRSTPSPSLRHQCLHGTGHGIALLGEGDIDAGIAACERSFASDAATCVGGLMMEVHYFQRIDGADRSIRACGELQREYRAVCYQAIGSGALARAAVDEWGRAAHACAPVPARHQATCSRATGEAAAELGGYDADRILETCRSSVDQQACREGAASIALRFGGADAARLCARLGCEREPLPRVPGGPADG